MPRRGKPVARNRQTRVRRRHRSVEGTSYDALTPASISGLVGWYDFADVSTLWQDTARTSAVTTDAQSIQGVTDKSGSGKHLSNAVGGLSPTYKVNIQAGRSVSRYNGAAPQNLKNAALASTQGYTVILVASVTDTSVNQYILDGEVQNAGVIRSISAIAVGVYAGTVLNAAVTNNTSKHIYSGVFNGVSSAIGFDGVLTSEAAGAGNTTAITIGTDGSSLTPMTGDIAEVCVYNSVLSSANHNIVGRYLAYKWGLTWTTVP